ncbi:MAG: hypothetical protein FWB91_05510 [Defluviitaleaceae bacterium]|nr:hypothetical protein [Defluviitaleaceae bacterium]
MKSLYAKKIFLLKILIAVLLFFAACGDDYDEYDEYPEPPVQRANYAIDSYEALALAIYDGMIIELAEAVTLFVEQEMETVQAVDIIRTYNLSAFVGFSHRGLFFEYVERSFFSELYVEIGQLVSAGEVLASAWYEPTEIFLAQHRQARNDLNRFEQNDIPAERARRQGEIERTRQAMFEAPAGERERYALMILMQEQSYESFVFESRQRLQNMREDVLEMESRLAGERLIAPFDGLVTARMPVSHGDPIRESHVIVVVQDLSDMMMGISVGLGVGRTALAEHEQGHVLRYGDVFPMAVVSPAFEFYVRVASDPFAGGRPRELWYMLEPVDPSDIERLLYAVDNDWLRFTRLNFHIHPTWHMFSNAMVLPQRAVRFDGLAPLRPYVLLYDNGVSTRRFITLGHHEFTGPEMGLERSGRYFHILSGLEVGQKVILQ